MYDLGPLIDRVRGFFGRRRSPRLAAGTIGGLVGVIVATTSLLLAVPIGLSGSVALGVALTWVGVILGTASALVVVLGTIGYVALWLYQVAIEQ